MDKGTSLQNRLWDVLVRSRFHPVTLRAESEKSYFLQIHDRENERDCLRFNWFEATSNDKMEIYRFSRLVFGVTQPPLILKGTWIFILATAGKNFESLRR